MLAASVPRSVGLVKLIVGVAFQRPIVLLPGYVSADVTREYAGLRNKNGAALLRQVRLALAYENKDAHFWRCVCARLITLIEGSAHHDVPTNGKSHGLQLRNGNTFLGRKQSENGFEPQDWITHAEIAGITSAIARVGLSDLRVDALVAEHSIGHLREYALKDIIAVALALSCRPQFSHWFEGVGDYFTSLRSPEEIRLIEGLSLQVLVTLVEAFYKANVMHQGLYGRIAIFLILRLAAERSPDSTLLLRIVEAYAGFGLRHKRLLDAVASRVSLTSFTDEELRRLKRAYDSLQYGVEALETLFEVRKK